MSSVDYQLVLIAAQFLLVIWLCRCWHRRRTSYCRTRSSTELNGNSNPLENDIVLTRVVERKPYKRTKAARKIERVERVDLSGFVLLRQRNSKGKLTRRWEIHQQEGEALVFVTVAESLKDAEALVANSRSSLADG